MLVLKMISQQENIPDNAIYNDILHQLFEDDLIYKTQNPPHIYPTYFGFRELEDWDTKLEVSIDNQLLSPIYGEA